MSICSIGSTDSPPARAVSSAVGESSTRVPMSADLPRVVARSLAVRSPLAPVSSIPHPRMSSSVPGPSASSATPSSSRARALGATLATLAALSLSLAAAPARAAEAGPGTTLAPALQLQATGTGGATAARTAQPPEVTSVTPRATRAELTAAMERAERTAARASGRERERAQAEVTAIRNRLRDGDFNPGDRLALSVSGDTATREIMVREGTQIELPYGIPPLTLTGLLRSELSDAVVAHLQKYVREPDVRVRVLQRVGVVGAVGRPGVYWVQPDMALAEVIMRAGGPGQGARTDRIEVTRAGRRVIDRKTYARLVRDGRTVEESNVQPGDEIRVPERTQRNWAQIATYSFFAISALTAVLALIRSSYE